MLNILPISDHMPTHLKPKGDNNFGYYLAGLIDGKGIINNTGIYLPFHILDTSLAYFIKKEIGYGSVKKGVYIVYALSNKEGINKLTSLINNKLKSSDKISQLEKLTNIKLSINKDNTLNNYWLAGFSDILAQFYISTPNWNLIYKIEHYNDTLLLDIKNIIGGSIIKNLTNNKYTYCCDDINIFINIFHYFDKYHLLSSKHIKYLKIRKVYRIIQKGENLTKDFNGLVKLYKLKA